MSEDLTETELQKTMVLVKAFGKNNNLDSLAPAQSNDGVVKWSNIILMLQYLLEVNKKLNQIIALKFK